MRASAIYELRKPVNKKLYVDTFVECLRDVDPHVVMTTLQTLGRVRDNRLLAPLYDVAKNHRGNEHYIPVNLKAVLENSGFKSRRQFMALYEKFGDQALEEARKHRGWLSRLGFKSPRGTEMNAHPAVRDQVQSTGHRGSSEIIDGT